MVRLAQVAAQCKTIFDKYLSPVAPAQLNIGSLAKGAITRKFRAGTRTRDMFDAAQKEVGLVAFVVVVELNVDSCAV